MSTGPLPETPVPGYPGVVSLPWGTNPESSGYVPVFIDIATGDVAQIGWRYDPQQAAAIEESRNRTIRVPPGHPSGLGGTYVTPDEWAALQAQYNLSPALPPGSFLPPGQSPTAATAPSTRGKTNIVLLGALAGAALLAVLALGLSKRRRSR